MKPDYEELHRLAVAERKMLSDRIARVLDYNQELNRLELPPNGDDYNALLDLITGKVAVRYLPTEKGR